MEGQLLGPKVALEAYQLPGELVNLEPLGQGLINKTYIVEVKGEEGEQAFVLQAINHKIFPNVDGLMHNIQLATTYLKRVIEDRGGDPMRETLTVYLTKDGATYTQLEDGTYWRLYHAVEGTYSLDKVETPDQFYTTAKAFGSLVGDFKGFDASQLVEVLPKFHDTRDRYRQFMEAVEENRAGRLDQVQEWVDFVVERQADTALLYDMLDAGQIPLRLTHNDTKLNNLLFDKETKEPICIVDLDTLMPGTVLFDFGDAIRYGANHCAEDETDLEKIKLDKELFAVFAKGYLETAGPHLVENEILYLPWGARVITLEQGIRFLTDYLNGDQYYLTTRPDQNLDRARTQFLLVKDMEDQWQELQALCLAQVD